MKIGKTSLADSQAISMEHNENRTQLRLHQKARICMLQQALPRHGGSSFTIGISNYLQSTTHYLVTILNYKGRLESSGPEPEVVVRTPSLRGARYLPPPWRTKYVCWRRTRALAAAIGSADLVVNGCDHGPLLADAVRIATRLGKPLCCIVHTDFEGQFALLRYRGRWSKAQTLDLYRRVDKIVGVSHGLRDDLVRDLPERAEDILAIPNGIDLAWIDRMAAADCAGERLPTRPFFLGVGRLVHQKGFDILLRAHALARAQGAPEHAVVLVGEGGLRGELEQLAEQPHALEHPLGQ